MDSDTLQQYIRYDKSRWVGPLYYDYPDGEDLGGKLSFCGQVAFLLSAPIGIVNAYVQYPYPTSQKGRFMRVLRSVIPGLGMGLVFAATTYYATKIRQKDDYLNHCFGGIAAGAILGAATNIRNGIAAAAILGGLAGIYKQNGPRREKVHRRLPNYTLRSMNFGNIPDKGDNWVKAPPPEN